LHRGKAAAGIARFREGTRLALPQPNQERRVKHPEIIKLQKYLQTKFSNRAIDVRPRPKKDDSVEVYIGEEFIGLIYVDDEDGDRSYNLQMAILAEDLDEVS
jgi:hypothetical protein